MKWATNGHLGHNSQNKTGYQQALPRRLKSIVMFVGGMALYSSPSKLEQVRFSHIFLKLFLIGKL